MRQQWATDRLPVVTLDAANEPAQTINDGFVAARPYAGTCGSNLPDEAVLESHIGGNPDVGATITRVVAKTRAIDRA
jgi:hypothetical protein